jgi:hypothetical protein
MLTSITRLGGDSLLCNLSWYAAHISFVAKS